MMCAMTMAQAAGVHSTDNYVVFGEYCGESTVTIRAGGCFQGMENIAGTGGGWSQLCAHTWLWEPAAGTSLMVGDGCWHPQWWGLGPELRTRANFRDNGIYVCWLCKHTPMATESMGMHTAVEANDRSCARVCKFHRSKGCRWDQQCKPVTKEGLYMCQQAAMGPLAADLDLCNCKILQQVHGSKGWWQYAGQQGTSAQLKGLAAVHQCRPVIGDRAGLGSRSNSGGSGCWCAFLWLKDLTTGTCNTMEVNPWG